jgi:hypothetical protein
MKQETLEEAAERLYPISGPNSMWNSLQQDGFIAGASWQAEKMYSEEEVIELLEYVRKNYYDTGTIWHSDSDVAYTSEELIEQFKNKQ